MKKHIITISGDIASGKDTVKDILKEKLQYDEYLASKVYRQKARDMNLSMDEFQTYLDNNVEEERQTEASMGDYGLNHDNLIVVARMGFYVMPFSFKVYATVTKDEAAIRLFNSKRDKEDQFKDVSEAKESCVLRHKREIERYKKIYGVDVSDMNNYDLVVDTTNMSQQEVAEYVYNEYIKWIKN